MAAMEAVFIGMMLFTSIAVVNGITPRSPSVSPARHNLETVVHDALLGMENMPTLDHYNNLLEKAVAKAIVGNTTDLGSYLQRVLPPGAGYRLWLDNGQTKRLLAGLNMTDLHETVSAARLYHPTWDYTELFPGFDVVSPVMAEPMTTYEVAQGALVKEGGIPVYVKMQTDGGTYQSLFTTAIRNGPTARITMLDQNGQQGYTYKDNLSNLAYNYLPVYTNTVTALNGTYTTTFSVGSGVTTLYANATTTGVLPNFSLQLKSPGGAGPNSTFYYGLGTVSKSISSPAQGTWSLVFTPISGTITTSTILLTTATPTYNTNWTFVLSEDAGRALGPGANVTVDFPYPFTNGALTNTTQSGWTNIAWAPYNGGLQFAATLNTTLNKSSATLVLSADRTMSATESLYLVRAYLGGGPKGEASILVSGVAPAGTTTANPVEHKAYVSFEKPAAPAANASFGVVLANPSAVLNPASYETVSRVDVWTATGQPLFASLPAGSDWTLDDPTHVEWVAANNHRTLQSQNNGASTLWLNFTTAGILTADEAPNRIPASLAGGSDQFYDAVAPGVEVNTWPLSLAAGAAWGGGVSDQNATVSSQAVIRSALVNGTTTFNISNIALLTAQGENLRAGLVQSQVSAPSSVTIGQGAAITANFSGLLTKINSVISAWNLSVDVYDPAQPFEARSSWTPTLHVDNHATTFPPSAQYGSLSVNFTPTLSSIYGPYVIVASANFTLDNFLGAQQVETARAVGVINVTPDGGQAETALYWVILEAWMPDWA